MNKVVVELSGFEVETIIQMLSDKINIQNNIINQMEKYLSEHKEEEETNE